MAAEGSSVRSRGKGFCYFSCCADCANRHSAAKTFCHGYDIRFDAVVHVRHYRTGSAPAGLYFINQKQHVVLITELPESLHELFRCRMNTAFALYRLNHDGDGVFGTCIFEGLQIMDMLIFGLIAFLLFRFLAARRRQAQPAAAGGAPYQREMPTQAAPNSIFGGSSAAAIKPVINAPAWFNEQSFVSAGREHFLSLQQHWDANEMDKIAEFVTPQLLDFLSRERADLGDGFQSTYVDDLDVQLDGVDDLSDKTVATLTFTGVAKTSRFDQGEAFSESWRMERAAGDNQPWLVAGIRQNG